MLLRVVFWLSDLGCGSLIFLHFFIIFPLFQRGPGLSTTLCVEQLACHHIKHNVYDTYYPYSKILLGKAVTRVFYFNISYYESFDIVS